MKKRKNAIFISTVLLIVTTCFILLNSNFFLGSINNYGETHIELNYSDQPNVDEIKAIISKNSDMKEDSIEFDHSNGNMNIKFDAVDLEVVDSIELMMNEEFGDSIRVISTSIIAKPTRTFAYYLIVIVTATLFLVSILMITINSSLILKSRILRAKL
ncbi:MAG: hypothetical protein SCL54_15210 [Bacillota bacterium]|nr:hypothetical protein [Bacillota bacterium]